MSNPFVYTPTSSPRISPAHSPFIPPPSLPLSPSPYQSYPPLPPSPHPSPRRVHFDDELEPDSYHQPRQRRPSWHGPAPPIHFPQTPFVPPQPVALAPPVHGTHQRRHSFGASQGPPMWPRVTSSSSSASVLHPYLDARRQPSDFRLSLSDPRYNPVRVHSSSGYSTALDTNDQFASATEPPLSSVSIIHPDLSLWPIVIQSPSATVGDILRAIHRALNTPITQNEWERLKHEEGRAGEKRVSMAYNRRCKGVGSDEDRRRGVKRIDFLRIWDQSGRREVFFRGLTIEGAANRFKLVVA